MNHKRPPVPALVVVALILIISIYFLVTQTLEEDDGALTASGTIETTVVNVSPEMAGRVKDVLAAEGQPVKAGDPLLFLDDSLLAAQRTVAKAGVDSAQSALLTARSAYSMVQAQYEAALTAARAQQGSQRLTDWAGRAPGLYEQPLWYFSRAEQITAAQVEVEAARSSLQQSESEYAAILRELENADLLEAEARLSAARIGYDVAKAVRDRAQMTGGKVSPEDIDIKMPPFVSTYRTKIAIAKSLSGDSDVLSAAEEALDAAEAELKEAQSAYNDLLTGEAANRLRDARAALTVAHERYETALDTLSQLQTGEYAPQVRIASASLEQAQAALQQAETAVRQAEASLALLDTQIAKLTVYAPMGGIVLTRNVEPGEFVQPGSTAFALADLGNITITVYIPEDRYGQISLGGRAKVTVDSFPGETFTAEVIHIADQAEFTPRNVQTVEGRSSTVYAIKLKVTDSEGKLKIGMPADVVFE